ncbi:MAG: DUF1800 domain-containing protein [Myxococcales bacterium]
MLAAACARQARKDLTPPLAADAPRVAAGAAAEQDPEAGPPLSQQEQIDHALSRVTFGARPADRERVARIGVAAFLEEQLHPEEIADAAVEGRLARFAVLRRSAAELAQELERYRKERREARAAATRTATTAASPAATPTATAGQAATLTATATPTATLTATASPTATLTATPTATQTTKQTPTPNTAATESDESVIDAPDPNLAAVLPRPGQRDFRKQLGKAGRGPAFDMVAQLAQAKLVRAIGSDRQLQEVMAEFWFNHFNVFAGKENEAALLPAYEQRIRELALGRFGDLLAATAHSPAMLVYLDNWRSSTPLPPRRSRRSEARRRDPNRGLNENYARELLELHTLGVDGGYDQQDIVEVARCFTGWTVAEPRRDPRFVFRPGMHDPGPKRVLGHEITAGGEDDGNAVLDLLSRHPSTAQFISRKLVQRFVSDDPPDALVQRAADAFSSTGGDIRSVLRTIFESPEMWSRRALRGKVRTPLELVAGSVRALGARVDDPMALARAVARIGQPLFAAQPPTGYPDDAASWLSSGALLARIDFGLALASGQMEGVRVDLAPLARDAMGPEEMLDRAAAQLGMPELSDRTRQYVLAQLRGAPPRSHVLASRALGLLLGSPELQRR